jgi:adiponectin receptor
MRGEWGLILLGGLVYAAGAGIYVSRVPERCYPGKFDLCGASHQIFHCAVIVACCLHFYANVLMYRDGQNFECII